MFHRDRDKLCGLSYRHVFPDAYDAPSISLQGSRHPLIASSVSSELGRPVLRIRRRHPAVFRAPVPEAPIDEHGYTGAREYNVDFDPDAIAPAQQEVLPKA